MSTHLEGDVKFTLEPANPSYAKNGSTAKLVWDYHADNRSTELAEIVYSVETNRRFRRFTKMLLINNDGSTENHTNIPAAYKGRVKIEGNATLVIEDINLQDNTRFKCQIFPIPVPGLCCKVESIVQLIVTGMYY